MLSDLNDFSITESSLFSFPHIPLHLVKDQFLLLGHHQKDIPEPLECFQFGMKTGQFTFRSFQMKLYILPIPLFPQKVEVWLWLFIFPNSLFYH